ncbi:uncharacterized protein LOC114757402 [Neltuma alba]|uniref:uncharacterized protein LOC114757402 n=1 Tax=Neltuma alba TaxID=207710 RepID=UPI0010A4D5DE|nr:uncharacterized protein LOC114757402 [Prosopis alba]
MKRKEVDEFYDDSSPTCLSNSSRKFRRLDAEFVSVMEEDPNVNAPQFVQRGLSPELSWTSTAMVHTDVVSVAKVPTSNAMEERAFMLYDPAKTPFAMHPSLQKFPIVVQSDLIPGLKDYLSSWGTAKLGKSEEDRTSKEKSSEASRDSLVAVPCVKPRWPVVCEERLSVACDALEAEGQMMDVDEPNVSRREERDMDIGEKIEAVGVMPPCQQQHHMMLSLSQNTHSRMSW